MNKKILILMCVFVIICIAITINKFLIPKINETKKKILKNISIILVFICLIFTFHVVFVSNQDNDSNCWNAELMNYKELHKYSTGKSQTIVLIDSGISNSQIKQVKENISLTNDDNEFDLNGHGTMMLSILKGFDSKIDGIAPDVNVVSIKIMDESGASSKENMIKALETASEIEEVSVVNLSMGSYLSDDRIETIINELLAKGISVVASTGDYETTEMLFPASMEGVISVGALSANGRPWDYTNGSEECIILAPGDEIKSLSLNGKIEYNSGTSQSSILISGYIALLKDYAVQNAVEITNKDVISVLTKISNNKISYKDGFSEVKSHSD